MSDGLVFLHLTMLVFVSVCLLVCVLIDLENVREFIYPVHYKCLLFYFLLVINIGF